MKITVFAKNHTTKEGRSFQTYVTQLTKKDGSKLGTALKFNRTCPIPTAFPCIIEVNKEDCNFSEKVRRHVAEDGTEKEYTERTLWISAWKDSGEEFVDHSMDDFE